MPGAGDVETDLLEGLKTNSRSTWFCEQGSLKVEVRRRGGWMILMPSVQRPNKVTCSQQQKLRKHSFCLWVQGGDL